MPLIPYRDLKKGVPAQPAPHQIKKKRHTKQKKSATPNKKKDALNVNSTHPIISKLLEYYFLKKSFTASLATIRSSNT